MRWLPTIFSLKIHQTHDCNFMCTKLPTTDIKLNKFDEALPENLLKFINFEKQLSFSFVI